MQWQVSIYVCSLKKRSEIILDNVGHFSVALNLQLYFLSKN